jgi:hypothetical protein
MINGNYRELLVKIPIFAEPMGASASISSFGCDCSAVKDFFSLVFVHLVYVAALQ